MLRLQRIGYIALLFSLAYVVMLVVVQTWWYDDPDSHSRGFAKVVDLGGFVAAPGNWRSPSLTAGTSTKAKTPLHHVSKSPPATYLRKVESDTLELPKLRVYAMVPTQWSKAHLWDAVIETWAPQCDVIKFFVAADSTRPHSYTHAGITIEVVHLPIVRNDTYDKGHCMDGKKCRHIWEKVWRAWVYVAEHDLDSAEWFFKVDDDTLFVPRSVRGLVLDRGWSPEELHYFGHKLYHQGDRTPLIAGAATGMSRAAVRRIAALYNKMDREYGDRKLFRHGRCVDRDGATEERTTSICMRDAGIPADHTRNELGQERVLLFAPSALLGMIRRPDSKGWYWKNKPREVRDGGECCASDPIAVHGYKNAGTMRDVAAAFFTRGWEELQAMMRKYKEGDKQWAEQLYLQRVAHELRGVGPDNPRGHDMQRIPPRAIEAYYRRHGRALVAPHSSSPNFPDWIDLTVAQRSSTLESRCATSKSSAVMTPNQKTRMFGLGDELIRESCGFSIHQANVPESVRSAVLGASVSLPLHARSHCLYYACVDASEYSNINKQCIIGGRPSVYTGAVRECFANVGPERAIKRLGDIDQWGSMMPTQHHQNTNPNIKPVRVPADPYYISSAEGGSFVSYYEGTVRSLSYGESYHSHIIPGQGPKTGKRVLESDQKCIDVQGKCTRSAECKTPCFDRMIVLSQPFGHAVYHFYLEALPRLAPVLDQISTDPGFFVHVSLRKPFILSALADLGIPDERVVEGDAYAEKLVVPNPGITHEPMAMLWGIHALRAKLGFEMIDQIGGASCHTEGPLRVQIIVRKLTKLSGMSVRSYDRIEMALKERFERAIDIVRFEDTNTTLMGSYRAQVNSMHDVDVVIGAHGAALAHTAFMRPGCAAVISMRNRGNSDIFAHLALSTGVEFHHVLWRYNQDSLIEDLTSRVWDIGHNHPGLRRFASLRIGVLLVYTGKRGLPRAVESALWTYHANRDLLDLFIVVEHGGDELRGRIKELGFGDNVFVIERPRLSDWIRTGLKSLVNGLDFDGVDDHDFGWDLCDVRPFFGALFAEDLASHGKYSHWAWTDVHTYLGNLSSFLTEDVLLSSDVVSFKELASGWSLFTSGTFTVVRNTQKGRSLWSLMEHAQVVRTLRDPKNNENDEFRFSNAVLKDHAVTMRVIFANHRDHHTAMLRRTASGQLEALMATNESASDSPWMREGSGSVFVASAFAPLRSPVPVEEIRGRWEPQLDEKHRGRFAFTKDISGRWWREPLPPRYTEVNGQFVHEVAVMHSRHPPLLVEPHRFFVTFERYGGRLNNQLFQLAAAFQVAKRFGRTLVVPLETRPVDWTGMFESRAGSLQVWDLAGLDASYDWMLENEYEERFGSALGDHPDASRPECTVDPKVLFPNPATAAGCRLVNLGGATRLLNCGKNRFCGDALDQRLAFEFYSALRPHPSVLHEAAAIGRFPLALHSRSFLGSGNPRICPDKSDEVLRKHLAQRDEQVYEMAHAACKTNEPERLRALALMFSQNLDGGFVYSSDSKDDIDLPSAVRVPATKLPVDLTGVVQVKAPVSKRASHRPKESEVRGILQILVEQRVLAAADYFIGNLFSTFSFTVCMIRGEALRWQSNVCPLDIHPDQRTIQGSEYWRRIQEHTTAIDQMRRD